MERSTIPAHALPSLIERVIPWSAGVALIGGLWFLGWQLSTPPLDQVIAVVLWLYPLLRILAAAIFLRLAQHPALQPRERRGWLTMGGGVGLAIIGDLWWLVANPELQSSPVDWLFVLSTLSLAIGLWQVISAYSNPDPQIFWLDSLIVTIGAFILFVAMVSLSLSLPIGQLPLAPTIIATPVIDLFLLFSTVALLQQRMIFSHQRGIMILGASFALLFCGDISYLLSSLRNAPEISRLVFNAWVGSLSLLVVGGAVYQQQLQQGNPQPMRNWRAERIRELMPYIAVITGYGLVLFEELSIRSASGMPLLPISVAILTLLVLARQNIALRRSAEAKVRLAEKANLQRRLKYEQSIAQISGRLLSLGDEEQLRPQLNEAFITIREVTDVDLVFLGQLHPDQVWRTPISAVAPGLAVTISPKIAATHYPILSEKVRSGEMMVVNDFDELAVGALKRELEPLRQQQLRALLVVPINRHHEIYTALGLLMQRGARIWSEEEIRLVQVIGDLISNSLVRNRIRSALRESEARYRLLADHATDIIASHDRNGSIRYCSPASQALLGYAPDHLIGTLPPDLIPPEELGRLAALFARLNNNGTPETITFRARHADGREIWLELVARVAQQHEHEPEQIITVTRDVSNRRERELQIERLAYSDALTGLANRRRFGLAVERALANSGWENRVALIFFDLDRFKFINDSLGHDAGDELLTMVAARLQANAPTGTILARLGGDEFALLLPGATNSQASLAAEQMLVALNEPFLLRGSLIHVEASAGVAITNDAEATLESLLRHADLAMYRAKRDGGTYRLYDQTIDQISPDRLALEAELRMAISHDLLLLYYQPIVHLLDSNLVAAEALVRWPHPQRGMIQPNAFISLAEESGLICDLDRWVLRQALRQMIAWGAQAPPYVTINLSARTIQSSGFVAVVCEQLAESGLDAARLVVEVTERTAIQDQLSAGQVLNELRRIGVRVALDDFGSGYASLQQLRDLPVDVLKIDRSFATGLGAHGRDEDVMRAILNLGRALGLSVIAEGIAEVAQLDWLVGAGCRNGQGFLLGRPMLPEHLVEMAKSGE